MLEWAVHRCGRHEAGRQNPLASPAGLSPPAGDKEIDVHRSTPSLAHQHQFKPYRRRRVYADQHVPSHGHGDPPRRRALLGVELKMSYTDSLALRRARVEHLEWQVLQGLAARGVPHVRMAPASPFDIVVELDA